MNTSPGRLALIGALLTMLVFSSGVSAQTTETASATIPSVLDQRSNGTIGQRYGISASRSSVPTSESVPTRLVPPGTSPASSPQAPAEGIQKRDNEWGVWGGIAFHSPTWIGKTPEARFGNVGLRYGRVLLASKTVAFEWTIDAIPLAILSNNRFSATTSPSVFTFTRKSAYGFGAAPIGLKFNFRRNRRVQPFGHATGGFLYFDKQVPVDGASQFNFTFDFSGGVQIVNSNRRSFSVGYKYQHISNGYTGTFNPGVDLQMIFVGFSIFK